VYLLTVPEGRPKRLWMSSFGAREDVVCVVMLLSWLLVIRTVLAYIYGVGVTIHDRVRVALSATSG
jgi:hypothetical protein